MERRRTTAQLVPLLAACLLTQGCVGFVVARSETQTLKSPLPYGAAGVNNATTNFSTNVPTAAWLRDHWGKPTGIRPGLAGGLAERCIRHGQTWGQPLNNK